jgi:ferredoxin-NADP reductase
MTTSDLALLIALALFVQLAAFTALAWRRRQQQFRSLGQAAAVPPLAPAISPAPPPGDGLAWQGAREFIVRRRAYEDAARDVCSFYLAPADGQPLPPFLPGQYLTFELALRDAASGELRTLTRCYSLSDSPDPGHYQVTIKRVGAPPDRPALPPGLASNHFHDRVAVGSRLAVRAPAGRFCLDGAARGPVVLIGGGIGITPLLSMLPGLLEQPSPHAVWLFYGVRDGSEHLMKDRLRELAARHPRFQLHVCYSRPRPTDRPDVDYRHQGRIDVALLRNTLQLARYQFYVCGPAAMMQNLVPALEEWGVDSTDIHYEAFGPATVRRPRAAPHDASAAGPSVSFRRSGRTLQWEGQADSLLAFAEAHGIAVESGCRAGSCGGCQTRIEHGEVEYLQTPAAVVAPGHCLPCICVPKGNLTLAA